MVEAWRISTFCVEVGGRSVSQASVPTGYVVVAGGEFVLSLTLERVLKMCNVIYDQVTRGARGFAIPE